MKTTGFGRANNTGHRVHGGLVVNKRRGGGAPRLNKIPYTTKLEERLRSSNKGGKKGGKKEE